MTVFVIIAHYYEENEDVQVVSSIDKAIDYVYNTMYAQIGDRLQKEEVGRLIKNFNGYANYSVFPKIIDNYEN